MKFLLDNPSFEPDFTIKHRDRLFFIGSCFADTMSQYFEKRKFNLLQNPFGVLYNPISIADCIEHIAEKRSYNSDDFYGQDDICTSWFHHSSFSNSDADMLVKELKELNQSSFSFLQSADVAFVTLGTAWAFYHREKEMVVANNHRAPGDFFEPKLLSIREIELALERIVAGLSAIRKDIKIVFTISPVRHSRQGLTENNRSKARLLEAVHYVCANAAKCSYLPSYELVIDVLRDYRFFEKDLVHPNSQATDYVWRFIQEEFLDKNDFELIDKLYNLHLASQHKLKHVNSDKARLFIKEQLSLIEKLCAENEYLDLGKELSYFKSL